MLCKMLGKLKLLFYYAAVRVLASYRLNFTFIITYQRFCHSEQWIFFQPVREQRKSCNEHFFLIFKRQAMSFSDNSMSEVVDNVGKWLNIDWSLWWLQNYLLVRSFYPNLVKDTTAPASEGAEPDARELHAVRQPIQAFHQPLNTLTDDAIIPDHRGKTALLSLSGKERKGKIEKIWFGLARKLFVVSRMSLKQSSLQMVLNR